MTEAEWLAGTDCRAMLRSLRGRASDRKLRLFACACWQRLRHLLQDGHLRWFLGLLEPHADGLVPPQELWAARQAAWVAGGSLREGHPAAETRERLAARRLGMWGAHANAWTSAVEAGRTARGVAARIGEWAAAAEAKFQCDLLREVFGNPFRHAAVEPAWLAWEGGTVPRLAGAVYEGRTFDQLPILGDALEEAGCTDADLLAHCRQQPGAHVRGCWVIDLLLGKD
jgi:hypothetical protein